MQTITRGVYVKKLSQQGIAAYSQGQVSGILTDMLSRVAYFQGKQFVVALDAEVVSGPCFEEVLTQALNLARAGIKVVIIPDVKVEGDLTLFRQKIKLFLESFETTQGLGKTERCLSFIVQSLNKGQANEILVGHCDVLRPWATIKMNNESGADQPFLGLNDFAVQVSMAMGAEKLIFLSADGGVNSIVDNSLLFRMGKGDIEGYIKTLLPQKQGSVPSKAQTAKAERLREVCRAIDGGVKTVHIVEPSGFLMESLTDYGTGTIITAK